MYAIRSYYVGHLRLGDIRHAAAAVRERAAQVAGTEYRLCSSFLRRQAQNGDRGADGHAGESYNFV